MFEKFEPPPEDPIIQLIGIIRNDPRPEKIDMGVGVFMDDHGQTPVLSVVRKTEELLHEQQTTKAYVGVAGNETFNSEIIRLAFGDSADTQRIRGIQMPGGCGALRMLSDMLHRVAPDRKVRVSDPTWGNHYPIFRGSGFEVDSYPYLEWNTRTVDVDRMMSRLSAFGQNDIVVFHACCHNPSGAELSPDDWNEIARLASQNGFFPFFDMAYQGFGDSLHSDAYSIRKMAQEVEAMVVASSCSKNFGLYRERVGCAMIVGESPATADVARAQLLNTARSSYSMPPDHGAALVAMILTDPRLRQEWEGELQAMRNRILSLRGHMSTALREASGTPDWDFIADHRGMFSLLVLDKQQVERLRNDHAVYCVAGGRINIAGLKNADEVQRFADALIAVTR